MREKTQRSGLTKKKRVKGIEAVSQLVEEGMVVRVQVGHHCNVWADRENIRAVQDLLGHIRRDFDTTRHFFYFR